MGRGSAMSSAVLVSVEAVVSSDCADPASPLCTSDRRVQERDGFYCLIALNIRVTSVSGSHPMTARELST